MSKQCIKIDKKRVGGISMYFEHSIFFLVCPESGQVCYYKIEDPADPSSYVSQVAVFPGGPKPISTCYNPKKHELYVGHANGCLSVYELGSFQDGPICKLYDLFRCREHP